MSEVKRYKTSPGWYEINDVAEYNGASVRLKPSYTSSTEFKANLEDKQKEVSKDVFRQRDNMSDASEVKRWTLTQLDRLSSNSWENPTFVSSQDHDRIVVKLKAEVARQAKVIEKLKLQRGTILHEKYAGFPLLAMNAESDLDKEIEDIEQGKGKDEKI